MKFKGDPDGGCNKKPLPKVIIIAEIKDKTYFN
jgi:hypothetical protein